MRLSALQKDILTRAVLAREPRVSRTVFAAYYTKRNRALTKDEQNAITKSIERLVEKGLLVGYGRRTPQKWFIESVRLTPFGRRIARALFGTQTAFPFAKSTR